MIISASLKAQLQQSGYSVCGCSMRGEICLEEIRQLSTEGREPEIILMDIHLRGDMDGIETARIISENYNCAIIFLTGQSSKEVYESSFKIKPFGYLLKPIDMEQMRMTIEIAAYQRGLEIENKIYQRELEYLLEKRSQENIELIRMYDSIINNSLLGLTIVQDGKLIFANSRTADIFGYPIGEFQKFSIHDIMGFIHEDDRGKLKELMDTSIFRNGIPRHILVRIISSNGEQKYIDTHVSTVQYKEKPAFYQTFLDITTHLE